MDNSATRGSVPSRTTTSSAYDRIVTVGSTTAATHAASMSAPVHPPSASATPWNATAAMSASNARLPELYAIGAQARVDQWYESSQPAARPSSAGASSGASLRNVTTAHTKTAVSAVTDSSATNSIWWCTHSAAAPTSTTSMPTSDGRPAPHHRSPTTAIAAAWSVNARRQA